MPRVVLREAGVGGAVIAEIEPRDRSIYFMSGLLNILVQHSISPMLVVGALPGGAQLVRVSVITWLY